MAVRPPVEPPLRGKGRKQGLAATFDAQFVRYRENSRHRIRPNVGEIPVHFIRYDAFERNVPIPYYDANRPLRIQAIPLQRAITVD